jgi:hypothetical protein
MQTMKKLSLVLILIIFAIPGCYPNIKPNFIKMNQLTLNKQSIAPTKAYLKDASVILFPAGFNFSDSFVSGSGQRFWLSGKQSKMITQKMQIDSIIAMTYYEKEISATRGLASFSLGIFGLAQTGLALYCLSCPKCCFGSCPTVYTFDGKQFQLETELFSYSISKLLEEEDLDLLTQKIPDSGLYKVRITNEALETHHLNKLSLLTINHPIGTAVYPSASNGFIVINDLSQPDEVINSSKKIVSDLVTSADSLSYRSDLDMITKLKNGLNYDWLQVKMNTQQKSDSVTMVIRYRNTLLSTILFYDVVLASQGISAVEWTRKMNEDSIYASQFNFVYNNFSGISVFNLTNNKWEKINSINDAGPIVWKYIATKIPVDSEGNINIKLQFFPDNFLIDYIAFDVENNSPNAFLVNELYPTTIFQNSKNITNEIIPLIENDDDLYLITNPGESYLYLYDIPITENIEQTIFIKSKGYYTEWIRGSWVRNNNSEYIFDLYDIKGTIRYLTESWMQNKDLIEKEFFKTRIPLKEAL